AARQLVKIITSCRRQQGNLASPTRQEPTSLAAPQTRRLATTLRLGKSADQVHPPQPRERRRAHVRHPPGRRGQVRGRGESERTRHRSHVMSGILQQFGSREHSYQVYHPLEGWSAILRETPAEVLAGDLELLRQGLGAQWTTRPPHYSLPGIPLQLRLQPKLRRRVGERACEARAEERRRHDFP